MQFKTPMREKISTQIVHQIRTAILNGELKPGHALPHEQDLMAQLNVSKHTLREALRTLEGMGFLSIKRGAGGGPIVNEIDWSIARDHFASFLYFQNFTQNDIFEVRMLLEPYIAKNATKKMTVEYLQQLKSIHNKCLDAFNDNQEVLLYETEVLFHVLLAKIAGNPIFWATQDFVNHMLMNIKHQLKPQQEFAAEVLRAHERILDALEKRDPDAAANAMYQHMLEVKAGLTGSL